MYVTLFQKPYVLLQTIWAKQYQMVMALSIFLYTYKILNIFNVIQRLFNVYC